MKNVDVVLEGALAQKVAEEGAAVVVEKSAGKLLTKVAKRLSLESLIT